MPPFAEIWKRIQSHAGSEFSTKRGLPFTYSANGDVLDNHRVDHPLHRHQFEKAYALVPCAGPGELNHLVRGPSFVWAILHDPRIRQNDW